MYVVGKVYIWQNQTANPWLNGCETTVLSAPIRMQSIQSGEILWLQKTDTPSRRKLSAFMGAKPGDLRPKNPPSGEQRVRDMFDQLPTEAQLQAHAVDEALEAWWES